MCSGPRKPSTPPLPAATAKESAVMAALLLELAAADDLVAFRRAVEDDKVSTLDAACQWYGPSAAAAAAGGARLRLEMRTPAMVAALYGSTGVLAYVLSAAPAEAARTSPTDGATPLHLAAAGGAAGAVAATHLLLAAGASADALAFSGLRAGDLLPRANAAAERDRALRVLLKSPAASPSSSPKKSASPPPAVPEPRKEYPPDLTLPDLKSGLFSTDEFRMYSFKVKPCSRAYSHDWTECPFVHPGENARRRDPRRYSYSCVPCPEFRKGGACRKGDNCEYAHGVFECWLHPAQYRTRLCKDEVGCARRICFFAHKHEELRSVNPSAVSVGMQPAVSSPRSSPPNGLDMGGMLNAAAWPSSPASRLKTALAGRELDFDLELLALDQYQQKLFDKVSSPRASWGSTGGIGSPLPAATPARAVPDYTDLLGSVDPAMLSQLHALSLKQAGDMPAYNSTPDAQLHMPTSPMVVLDVGCGTGILSVFCARAGAKRVYAVDASEIANQAREIVKANNLTDQVIVIHGRVEDVDLEEKVDVIISEWMGYMLLYESMLPSVLFARDKWLKPGGLILPSHATLFMAPITNPERYEGSVDFWCDVYGINMSALVPLAKKFTSEEPSIEIIGGENVISWPSVVKHIDCYNFTAEEFKSITANYKVSSMMLAPIHGFGFWFEVEFNGPQESSHNIPSNLNPLEIIQKKRRRSSEDTVLLSTAPEDEPTHWQQTILYFPDPIEVKQDQTVEGCVMVSQSKENPRFLNIHLECSTGGQTLVKDCTMR